MAFITSLRHPDTAEDYSRVESQLQDTLASVTQQTSDDYVVILVGNRQPSFALPERVHFIEVDYSPPTTEDSQRAGLRRTTWDKGTKLGIGLAAARALGPEYVMFLDADDFVHRDLAAFAHAHPGQPGWFVKQGWIYSRARNSYALRRRLFRVCGTSHILPLSAFEIPDQLDITSSREQVVDAFGEDCLERVIAGHRYALEWWRARGRSLAPLPFAGTVYHVDTGENDSGNRLLGPAMPYRPHLARDFGVHPSKTPRATLWSAFGPAAFKPDLRVRRPAFLQPKAVRAQRISQP